MSTTRLVIRNRLRGRLDDWPELGVLDGNANATQTAITLASAAMVQQGNTIEIDDEAMYVSAIASNVLTVQRGFKGTTGATHADLAGVNVIAGGWRDGELNEAIEDAIDACYPFWYRKIRDVSLATLNETRRYSVAALDPGVEDLIMVRVADDSDNLQRTDSWHVSEDEGSKTLEFDKDPAAVGREIELTYLAAPAKPSADTATTDVPVEAVMLYAQGVCTERGIHRRARFDEAATELEGDAMSVGEGIGIEGLMMFRFKEYCERYGRTYPGYNLRRRRR